MLVVLAMLLLVFSATVFAQPGISAGWAYGMPGEKVSINVFVSQLEGWGINRYNFSVDIPTGLEVVGIKKEIGVDNFQLLARNPGNRTYVLSGTYSSLECPPLVGEGVLFTIFARIDDNVPKGTWFDLFFHGTMGEFSTSEFSTQVLCQRVVNFTMSGSGWTAFSIPIYPIWGNEWNMPSILPIFSWSSFGGYHLMESCIPGKGYMTNLESNMGDWNFTGIPIESLADYAPEGWSLLGSIYSPIAITDVLTTKYEALYTKGFVWENGKFVVVDSLMPGKATWGAFLQGTKYSFSCPPYPPNYLPSKLGKSLDMEEKFQAFIKTHGMPPAPNSQKTTGIADQMEKPNGFALMQNYPNPFNPSTSIQFGLPNTSHVSINIYNLQGALVRSLIASTYAVGYQTITWDGRDDNGQNISAGTYIYRLESENLTLTKKMIYLK